MYLKKVDSAIDDKATGDGWFKLFDHGYDASTKRWCTDEIIDNKGLFNINLPKGLEGGQYLARPEILALHAANGGDPQFYTGCAQIFLESSGNLGPESTVSIPGHVKYGQPSTDFDIYNSDLSTYTVPGPAVAKLVAKSDSASISSTQSQGLKPEGCLVENANWCGVEVPDYSDEKGCWASSEKCWDQSKVCYDSAGPTGQKGCELWAAKCEDMNNQCNAKNFNGPPNKGKILTPEKKSVDVGLIMATVGGGIVDAPVTPKTSVVEKPVESKTPTPAQPTPTPAAEEKPEVPAQSTPASSPPKASSPAPKPTSSPPKDAAPAPTPSSAPPKDLYNAQPVPVKGEDKPKPVLAKEEVSSITAPVAAPKPTNGPACRPGGKCVTVTEVETVVQTVYVTMTAGGYKRGVEGFKARRRHARHM
jgi:hypothetical protein